MVSPWPALLGASLCLPVAAVARWCLPRRRPHLTPPAPGSRRCPWTQRWRWPDATRPRSAPPGTRDGEAGVADASRAWRSPTLDLSVENLGPQDLDHDGFVWFTQPLDIGARRSTRIAAAGASRDFLAATGRAARRVVDLAVVDTYLGVVRARQASKLLAAHERALDEVVRLVERRVREGVAAEGDLRKLEAERGRTRIAACDSNSNNTSTR